MRTAKSLGLLLFVGLSNAVLIYGCSSDDADPLPTTEDGGGDAAPDNTSSITAEGGDNTDGSTDAKKDSKADAKKDTGNAETGLVDAPADVQIVYDPEGAPCGPLNRRETRPCGLCGKQERICLKSGDAGADSGDAGLPGVWYPWGACVNGVGAVCDPTQTYSDETCGNCGTRQRICQIDCTFVQGLACGSEGECKAGSTDWEEGLGCQLPDGGLYGRNKTCTAQCQYDIATSCTAPPPNPNFINVTSAATGGVFTKQFSFDAARKQKRLDNSSFDPTVACPLGALSTTQTMYTYVEVKNTTASNIKVSIWHSEGTAPNGEDDTLMAVYAGGAVPRTDAQRQNCIDFMSDGCDTTEGAKLTPKACAGSFNTYAGIIKGEELSSGTYGGLSIPANSSVTVYLGAYSSTATAGNFKLNVKVEQ